MAEGGGGGKAGRSGSPWRSEGWRGIKNKIIFTKYLIKDIYWYRDLI